MLAGWGVVLALDALVFKSPWPVAAGIVGAYLATVVALHVHTKRKAHLASVCEHGLVIETRGAASYVDWRDLASVAKFETLTGQHYDVNVLGATYRLSQHTLGTKLLHDAVDAIVQRSRFEWITDTLAARPKVLERYRPTRVQNKV